MGFWSNLKAKQEIKKKEKEHFKENKDNLTFSKELQKLSKKYKKLDSDFFDELEAVLIKADIGIKLTIEISNLIQKKVNKNDTFDDIKEIIAEELHKAYNSAKWKKDLNFKDKRLNIFIMVGVNGTGKTTSLAKIANYYSSKGKKVLIAAGDTFRAGAVEQLEEWIDKRLNNVDLIKGKKLNQDPASVVYDALEKAKNESYDLLLIDTAGRLQNNTNLMRELEKVVDIIHRYDKSAPHERLLVIDATTGQNGLSQAKNFSQATEVTGIVLTKLDGTSKGGIALAIKDQLNIPVKLVGIGEQVDDIIEFDIDSYIYDLVKDFMDGDLDQ